MQHIRTCLERRNVAAARQLDEHRIAAAQREVVVFEPAAQAARLDAHRRIDLGVERSPATEHVGRERVLLQAMGSPLQGLLHQEAQKLPRALGGRELGARENPLHLGANGGFTGVIRVPGGHTGSSET